MDHLEHAHDTTSLSRAKSLTDLQEAIQRLRGFRTEMDFGLEVDDAIVSELEFHVGRLYEIVAVILESSKKQIRHSGIQNVIV